MSMIQSLFARLVWLMQLDQIVDSGYSRWQVSTYTMNNEDVATTSIKQQRRYLLINRI